MFTGLIEEIGVIINIHVDSKTGQTILVIKGSIILVGIVLGDSIAVDGVCLTVTAFSKEASTFTVGLSPETLRRTTFHTLTKNSAVNLERSLTASSHIGGHYVQGHVDGFGVIELIQVDKDALRVVISAPANILKYIVEKGYIAIDGISLTVVAVNEGNNNNNNNSSHDNNSREPSLPSGCFEVMLIQYTQQKVTLSKKKKGQIVNLEVSTIIRQPTYSIDLLHISSPNTDISSCAILLCLSRLISLVNR